MYVYAFGLDEFCNAKANSLSGGQQQRLNVMLSLFHNPEILMFDELANNLDINIKKKILTFINLYIKSKNCTAIIISHDPLEINELATRIIFLSHGSIELDESKASVLKKYKTIGSFLEAKVG
jgi:ABC-2 type transport system ATP-binding protein